MSTEPAVSRKPKRNFFWRWTKRIALSLLTLAILYLLAAQTLCRIPTNREFVESKDGIEIAVLSNGIHVDIALPLRNEHFNWTDYLRRRDFVSYDEQTETACFGWGERTFYLETPTWWDIKPSNALRAFCGAGRSVMHVALLPGYPIPSDSCRCIKLSPAQYKKLCAEILATMKTTESGKLIPIQDAHFHASDAFYEAKGHYHLFHTCNAWAGDSLRASGVRVGLWTPTPGGVFACLPDPVP